MVSLHTVWNGSEADITFTVMEDELFMWEENKKENSSATFIRKAQNSTSPSTIMYVFFLPASFFCFILNRSSLSGLWN